MAGGVPTVDFSPLGDLAKIWREAETRRATERIGLSMTDKDADYRALAGEAFRAGNNELGMHLLTAAGEREAAKEGKAIVDRYYGPGATPAAPAAPGPTASLPAPPAPAPAPGGRIPSSARVIGDDEGERLGLYDPKPVQTSSLFTLGMQAGLPRPRPPGAPSAVPLDQPATVQDRAGPFAGPPQPSGKIPTNVLMQLSMNAPKSQRDTFKLLLEQRLKDEATPEDIKKYNLAVSQGEKENFTDWYMRVKRAGATAITVDQRGENAESIETGKGAGTRTNAMFAAAGAAPKTLMTLSRVSALLSQVEQGKLEPTRMTISAWAKSLGLDDSTVEKLGLDPKGLGSAQALAALTNEMVIGKIGAGGFPANNFSDADRSFLTDTMPKLANDPRANKIIVEVARRAAQADIEKAKQFMEWKKDPGNKSRSFNEFETEYAGKIASRDLFGDLVKEAEAIIGPRESAPATRQPQPGTAPQQPLPLPQPGAVIKGHRFKGGDPSDRNNWERVQ